MTPHTKKTGHRNVKHTGNKFRACFDSLAVPPCVADASPTSLLHIPMPCSQPPPSPSPAPSQTCFCEDFSTAETCCNAPNCKTQRQLCTHGSKDEEKNTSCPNCSNRVKTTADAIERLTDESACPLCLQTQPQSCPQGFNDENDTECPRCSNQNSQRRVETSTKGATKSSCPLCSQTQPQFCPSALKDEYNTECPICSNQNSQRRVDTTAKPPRESSCPLCSQKLNALDQEENACSATCADALSETEPSLDDTVCPNAATQTPCCDQIKPELLNSQLDLAHKQSSHQTEMPTMAKQAPVKSSGVHPSKEKMSADASVAVCHPVEACPCHFPPAFSQFRCTGNINGNCGCGQ